MHRIETEPIGILVQTKKSVESWATSFWGTRFPDTAVLGGSSLYRISFHGKKTLEDGQCFGTNVMLDALGVGAGN